MRQAWLSLRFTIPERRAVVCEGLRRIGFKPVDALTLSPSDGDVLVTWNRFADSDRAARIFEARGLPVLCMENCSFGSNSFAGRNWYHIARGFHNRSGCFPIRDNKRWDSLGVELADWRDEGGETVVLPQRGFGPAEVAQPNGWLERQNGRIRPHPGNRKAPAKTLAEDLEKASWVTTWGSAAAIQALMWGVKVRSDFKNWIAAQDNTTEGRLAMFRRLAWAQSTLAEIASGEAFDRLLNFTAR